MDNIEIRTCENCGKPTDSWVLGWCLLCIEQDELRSSFVAEIAAYLEEKDAE